MADASLLPELPTGAEAACRRAALPYWPLLLRRELAASYFSVSPSTFDALSKTLGFPPPVNVTGAVKAWHRLDLDAWAEARRAGGGNPWDAA